MPKPSSPFFKPKSKSKPKSENFLQKLFIRETCGAFKANTGSKNEPKVRPFTRLPGRLAFCLRDVVPISALEAGHIFLGFSKCGQFLLSYTQTHAENVESTMDSWRILYHFRCSLLICKFDSTSQYLFIPQASLVAFHALQKSKKGCRSSIVYQCWHRSQFAFVLLSMAKR